MLPEPVVFPPTRRANESAVSGRKHLADNGPHRLRLAVVERFDRRKRTDELFELLGDDGVKLIERDGHAPLSIVALDGGPDEEGLFFGVTVDRKVEPVSC